MQDKAIAAIGEWQLEENKELEPVDLYIDIIFIFCIFLQITIPAKQGLKPSKLQFL